MRRRSACRHTLACLVSSAGIALGAPGGQEPVPLHGWQPPPFYRAPIGRPSADGVGPGGAVRSLDGLPSQPLPFVAIDPCRVVDTRGGAPYGGGPFAPGEIRTFDLDSAPAPCDTIPATARAFALNFTVVNTTGPGYFSAYPTGPQPSPLTSTINFVAGDVLANGTVVPADDQGRIDVFSGGAPSDLVVDISGYYAPQSVVNALNGLTGALAVSAGANVTVTPSGQTVEVSAGPLVSSLEGLTGVVDVAASNGATVSAAGGTLTVGTSATSSATASTLVARDGAAGFAAGTIELSGAPALLTTGGGTRLLHRTGNANNVFLGASAGGTGATGSRNSAVGALALGLVSTGADNSAFGASALAANTTGGYNTAVGRSALATSDEASYNSAFGWFALTANTTGSSNSAFGAAALDSNTIGASNSAFGYLSLASNTEGNSNSAFGTSALGALTTGSGNAAFGNFALGANVDGGSNSAFGSSALIANTGGSSNSAFGKDALKTSTGGNANAAFGSAALDALSVASGNSAFGTNALGDVTTGQNNVGIGNGAGLVLTSGSNNIYIGQNVAAAGGAEANTIRIGNGSGAAYVKGIFGASATGGSAVFVDSNGKLGTISSSARFKEEIADLPDPSALLLSLRPVSFVYREDERRNPQAGLVAEEVEAVAPHLVVRGEDGEVHSVRYDQLVPLLLAEAQRLERENASLRGALSELAARVADLESAPGAPLPSAAHSP